MFRPDEDLFTPYGGAKPTGSWPYNASMSIIYADPLTEEDYSEEAMLTEEDK